MDVEGFWRTLNEGYSTNCPCCERHSEIRSESLATGLALSFRFVYKQAGMEPFHHPTVLKDRSRPGITSLKYWGLLEPSCNPNREMDEEGWWVITERGKEWLEEEIRLWSPIKVFDDIVLSKGKGAKRMFWRDAREAGRFKLQLAMKRYNFEADDLYPYER